MYDDQINHEYICKKAILEIWNFASMFKWFKESWLGFKQFIKTKIAEFVSNGAYPVNDRLLLIKIFSQNWLIIMSDVSLLEERIVDISRDVPRKKYNVKRWYLYRMRYKIYRLLWTFKSRPLWNKKFKWFKCIQIITKKQKTFIMLLLQKSIENEWDETWDNIAEISDRLLENMELKTYYETSKKWYWYYIRTCLENKIWSKCDRFNRRSMMILVR